MPDDENSQAQAPHDEDRAPRIFTRAVVLGVVLLIAAFVTGWDPRDASPLSLVIWGIAIAVYIYHVLLMMKMWWNRQAIPALEDWVEKNDPHEQ